MFDIGFWELLAVLTIGLLVLGPERLSQVVRTAGKWLGRARTMARNMQYELEREVAITDFDKKNTIATPPSDNTPAAAAVAEAEAEATDEPAPEPESESEPARPQTDER